MAKFCGKDFLIQRGYDPSGAWVTLTVYPAGSVVTAGGNVYYTVLGGTAGATAPSGTGQAIVDGTVTWQYISATATDGNGYRTISALKTNSLSLNNEQVDVTDKDDGQWRELLGGCGLSSMELSGSGSFTNANSHKAMMADYLARYVGLFRCISGAGDTFTGNFLCTTLERSGEFNQAEQFTIGLASAGAITYTAIP
jgi:predicted secreted protein